MYTVNRNLKYQTMAELFDNAPFTATEFKKHVPDWNRDIPKDTILNIKSTKSPTTANLTFMILPWKYLPREKYENMVSWANEHGLSEDEYVSYCNMWDCLNVIAQARLIITYN